MHAARERGAITMNLNSTPVGEPIYAKAGFRSIGTGQTWVRNGQDLRSVPGPRLQRLIIALGTGDLAALAGETIPTQLPNGLTAQELAARFHQQDSLRYLLQLGHVPEIIALWEAGLRDEAIAASADAYARELVTGSRGARPLHLAVEKGAGSLVLALIEAGADLHARDGEYRATPLDWAHACNKPTIARILHRAGSR
jgi:ankyrin repeat protein